MEHGLITFFNIDQCGFYRIQADPSAKGKRCNVHVNGTLEEALNHVTGWVNGREFSETIPWKAEENLSRTKIYVKDTGRDSKNGDQIIVYCKALTNDKGQLSGFVENAKVGSDDGGVIQIDKKAQGKKLVYGAPMYFWYIPEKDLIASIKFPHSVVDTENMCLYIKRCLDNFIDTPNKKIHNSTHFNSLLKKDIDVKNVLYRSSCDTFSTRFSMATSMKEITADDISPESLAPNITHLVVRETISTTITIEQDDTFFKLWNKITGKPGQTSLSRLVEIVEEISVTPAELTQILHEYHDQKLSDSQWNDVGFRTNNDDSTKWFSNYVVRKHVTLDPADKTDKTFFSADLLLQTLSDQREGLLSFTGAAGRKVS